VDQDRGAKGFGKMKPGGAFSRKESFFNFGVRVR